MLHYLPTAAVYPLCPELIGVVLVIGSGIWFGFQALIGLWLGIPLLSGAMAYLVEITARTANGFATPPTFTAQHFVELPALGFAALLLLGLAVVGVTAAERHAAPWVGIGGLVAIALALPASLVVLGLERRLLRALDPRRVIPLMFQGGIAYLVIAALTAFVLRDAVALLPDAPSAEELAGGRKGGGLLWALAVFYLALVAAHLLGAAVFLRRKAFDFRPTLEPMTELDESAVSLQESVARLLALADEEEHHSRHDAAVALLTTAAIGSHAPRPWLEELFEGACRRSKPYFAEAAGQRLVAHLVSIKQWVRALEVVVHAAQRWPRFQPANLDERVLLAQHAFDRHGVFAFRQLTERLEELGSAPQAVELGLLAARWRAEHDGDVAGALKLLAPLLALKAHPAHRRITALDAALRVGRGPLSNG